MEVQRGHLWSCESEAWVAWRPQDVGGARAMSSRESFRQGMDPPKRGKCAAVSKAGRAVPSESFDMGHGAKGLRIRPALSQKFLSTTPFFSFGMVTDILCHCVLEVSDLLFCFTGGYN